MPPESDVVVAQQPSGTANVATVVVTRPDGTIVHRQEVVLAGAKADGFQVSVSQDGELSVRSSETEEMLIEMRRIRTGLQLLTGQDLTEILP